MSELSMYNGQYGRDLFQQKTRRNRMSEPCETWSVLLPFPFSCMTVHATETDSATPVNPIYVTSQYLTNYDFNSSIAGRRSTTTATNNQLATNLSDSDANGYSDGKSWENRNATPFAGKMFTTLSTLSDGIYTFQMARVEIQQLAKLDLDTASDAREVKDLPADGCTNNC